MPMTDGLPEMSMDQVSKSAPPAKMATIFTLVPFLIGTGIAMAIFYCSKDYYDGRARKNVAMFGEDFPFVYLGGIFFSWVYRFVNMYPMGFKNRLMTGKAGNVRANMYIYKVVDEDKHVVLATEGDVGMYNRANRSMHHMSENATPVAVTFLLAGLNFPIAALVLMAVFCLGRVMHQVGYTTGYGSHGGGFVLALISTVTLEGLLFVAFLSQMYLLTDELVVAGVSASLSPQDSLR